MGLLLCVILLDPQLEGASPFYPRSMTQSAFFNFFGGQYVIVNDEFGGQKYIFALVETKGRAVEKLAAMRTFVISDDHPGREEIDALYEGVGDIDGRHYVKNILEMMRHEMKTTPNFCQGIFTAFYHSLDSGLLS